ncbi:monocarboxylate transporter 13-like [Chiloscyllium plagiosum]|uniref:monocarboxylate transporter 13-like n=1 Tax=Chiloscyllium plagiosum TaxID=36176 RepID=UPI001CB81747|nr:monocarboxylate transporter 13-like [Chiloscyllium plagiosum]XP_043539319.1 monocarboxylate transporter 13-like [Chiloscyllium plagiosum]
MAEPVIIKSPDGGWGWMIVLAGFLNNCLLVGVTRSFGVFFIHFIQYFQESSSRVSWITSIAMATQQFASPVGSVFGMYYGARPVVMVGAILAFLGMLTASFGQSLLHLYLSIGVLTGFGWALVFTPTMAMISRYFKRRRALATGLAFTGVGVASFFFSPLFQLLIDVYGWRGAIQILSAMMLNLCVCAALLRPITIQEDLLVASRGHSANGKKSTEFWNKVTSAFDLTLFLHRGFMVYSFAVTLMTTGYFVPYIHLVAHGKNLGLSDYKAAFLLSVTAIAETIARLFSGWLADLKLIRKIHMLFLWSIVTGISLLLIPVGSTYYSLVGVSFFYGFCSGGLAPLFFSTLPDIVGIGRILNATGLFLMLLSIGGLLGPPLSGFLEDLTGSYTTSFMTAGGFILAGSLVLFFLPSFLICTVVLSEQQSCDQARAGDGRDHSVQADVTNYCLEE